jgi:hypothetical protein
MIGDVFEWVSLNSAPLAACGEGQIDTIAFEAFALGTTGRARHTLEAVARTSRLRHAYSGCSSRRRAFKNGWAG